MLQLPWRCVPAGLAGGQTDIAGWGSSSIDLPLGEAQGDETTPTVCVQ
jgi:hypothetical protein